MQAGPWSWRRNRSSSPTWTPRAHASGCWTRRAPTRWRRPGREANSRRSRGATRRTSSSSSRPLHASARRATTGYAAVERRVDNLRAALAWAFAPAGDLTIGVCLAAASLPLWISTSLLGEAHAWTERAIERLDEAGLRGSPAGDGAAGGARDLAPDRQGRDVRGPCRPEQGARARGAAPRRRLPAARAPHPLGLPHAHRRGAGGAGPCPPSRSDRRVHGRSGRRRDGGVDARHRHALRRRAPLRAARTWSACSAARRPGPRRQSDPPRRLRSARHYALRPGPRPLGAGIPRPGRGSRPDRRGGGAAPAAPRHLVLRARLGSMRACPPGAGTWMRRGAARRNSSSTPRSTRLPTTCPTGGRRRRSSRCGRRARRPASSRSARPSSAGAPRNGMSS